MQIVVALATHDGGRFLPAQLESLAGQSRRPDALFVHDDGSADATWSVLEQFAATAPFPVHLDRGRGGLGPTRAFEQVVAAAEGDVVLLCDQDDVWASDKVARFEAAFRADPDVLLVFSDAEPFGEGMAGRGDPRTVWHRLGFHPARRRRLCADPLGTLANHYLVSGCTLGFRGTHRALVLPFPPELCFPTSGLEVLHDTWITLLLGALGPVTAIDAPLVRYRIHDAQAVGIPSRPGLGWVARLLPAEVRWRVVGRGPRGDAAHLAGMAGVLDAAAARLAAAGPGRQAATARADLASARDHLAARARIRGGGPRRDAAALVRAEQRAGRYRRFSFGLPSAGADLFRGLAGRR